MDRAPDYGFGGWEFESSRVHMKFYVSKINKQALKFFLLIIFFFIIGSIIIFNKILNGYQRFVLKKHSYFLIKRPIYYKPFVYKNFLIFNTSEIILVYNNQKKYNGFQKITMATGLKGWVSLNKLKRYYNFGITPKNNYLAHGIYEIIQLKEEKDQLYMKLLLKKGWFFKIIELKISKKQLNNYFF